jgi:hypothetical protein
MIRRIFIWWASRKMNRSQYRLDRRTYQGVFKPGFFAHLSETNFWQADNNPFIKARKRKRTALVVIALILIVGMAWVILESSKAIQLF